MLTRRLILIALSFIAAPIWAQTACKVIDPELQGFYQGGCRHGLADGPGEAIGTAIYRGDFVAGKKQGKGTKYWKASGDRYSGDFSDDKKDGYGRYEWGISSPWFGESYEGQYRNDQRQGVGTYFWSFGDRYVGLWEADKPVGTPTPGQIQRYRATQALQKVIGKVGSYVCRPSNLTGTQAQPVWEIGLVENWLDDRIQVRPIAPSQSAQTAASNLSESARWYLLLDWQACSPALIKQQTALTGSSAPAVPAK
ncbi:hypothetical protein [Parvibium lacunae]|nr:hypothetical protein [Parvibium lacunae]